MGTGSGDAGNTYSWSGSGTFDDSTLEDPTVTGLSVGTYTFKIDIQAGGFNLNYFEFKKVD